jgi:iron-sulfur cluster assembly accessory protein
VVSLTSDAAAALEALLREEGAADHGLRVRVVGGGCAGFSYDLGLALAPGPDEEELSSRGVRLFVDRRARPLLQGLVIGYDGAFRFRNPNARTTCSCGVSFGR